MLPLVRRIVEDILQTGRHMRRLAQDKNPSAEQVVAYEKLAEDLRGLVTELETLGCLYKDWSFSVGLVDFPSEIDGEKVLLCWSSDEDDLRFYHRYEDGFKGRKEIPTSYLATADVP